jgi:hypothetical protein
MRETSRGSNLLWHTILLVVLHSTGGCNGGNVQAEAGTQLSDARARVRKPDGALSDRAEARKAEEPQTPAPRCPPEMASIGQYCIDRWEAHLVAVQQDGSERPHPHSERPAEGVVYRARSEPGRKPQAFMSRIDAESACGAAGKRLCTVEEWYEACRGPDATTYPYGDNYVKGACNSGKPHLLTRLHGPDPRAWSYRDHFNDPRLAEEPGFLEPTGFHQACVSGYGTYDMVGNLHEWISNPVDDSLADKLPLTEGILGALRRNAGRGVFLGGFFSTTNQFGAGCNYVTVGHEPSYHDYSIGFRCCRDAEGHERVAPLEARSEDRRRRF